MAIRANQTNALIATIPINHREPLAKSAASGRGQSNCRSASQRSPIQCHDTCPTINESTIVPTRSAIA